MAYKTVRRNGRDVLINTATGKEVRPGERIGNELSYIGKGITDNLTYSDKVDARSGRRLTPKEVRNAEKPKASKPTAKPDAKPALSSQGIRDYKGRGKDRYTVPTGSKKYNDARNRQIEEERQRLKGVGNPPASNPTPAPSTSRSSSPAPARSSGSSSSTSKPSPKPVPQPAGKVPASSETYRDGGKGLYQGSKEYRDKVGGSGNPLLNRFRQDMGRDTGSGSKAEPKMSKPEDKSKYVASNGKPYMGPAFGSGKAEPAKPASPASPNKSEKGMTLAERMRRRRQSGMA
jgi:hypothetical protein